MTVDGDFASKFAFLFIDHQLIYMKENDDKNDEC